ncbi:MAG TPA: amidophosphoribosyltransferase [Candidatus Sumerlaeota bacterium]|nr:amidophosphoribosyltransferase [Candidatus Sumerlaeota bacterium]
MRDPEGCAVVGVYNHPDAAKICYLALYAMQHRGQESAGIASFDGKLHLHKGQGLVSDVFSPADLETLPGSCAIGHVRYSTTGSNTAHNAQPLRANYRGGHIAVAHNGNLTNADELAKRLEASGAIFQSTTDSELLIHLLAQNRSQDFAEALTASLKQVRGAYSITMLRDGELYAFKDPLGFRPLCMGTLPNGGFIVASESCALDIVGAQFLREIKPGEVVRFRGGEVEKFQLLPAQEQHFCVFELIYYSRPDSIVAGGNAIYKFRKRLGEELAREHPAAADVVIAVPDSSNPAAAGYAAASGIPLEIGLIRSHYVGRTFIQPTQDLRDFGAKMKYNPVREVLKDRRVVVVDDSIVRGTTAKKIVAMIRDSGAREVHFRVSAPPWKHPCFYGIDTPDDDDLLANQMTLEEIAKWMNVDSLGFISLQGLMNAMPKALGYCTTCFTGHYPEGRPRRSTKLMNANEAVEQEHVAAGLWAPSE